MLYTVNASVQWMSQRNVVFVECEDSIFYSILKVSMNNSIAQPHDRTCTRLEYTAAVHKKFQISLKLNK